MADLPPQAAQLIDQGQLEASLTPQGWLDLFASVDQANAERKGFRKVFSRKKKLPPAVEGFVAPLMLLLREDVEPEDEVALRFDLRPPQMTARREPPAEPPFTSIKEEDQASHWFAGGAKLADGARLQWQVSDYITRIERTKRNPRGKVKTKHRAKRRSQLDITLALPHDAYEVEGRDPQTDLKKVKVKEGDKRDSIRVRRVIKADDGAAQALDLDDFTTALGEAYAQARPKHAPAGGLR